MIDKYRVILEESNQIYRKDHESLLAFTKPFNERTTEIIMNNANRIEVGPDDDTKTIGTSSLGGCLAIVAIVEDISGKRRCGLAHYDPIYLRLEMDLQPTPKSVVTLFGHTGQVDKDKLTKKSVIVMAQDPDGQDKDFIKVIKLEAHYLLNCDDVIVIPYGSQASDRLDVTLPNNKNGSPSFRTKTEERNINW